MPIEENTVYTPLLRDEHHSLPFSMPQAWINFYTHFSSLRLSTAHRRPRMCQALRTQEPVPAPTRRTVSVKMEGKNRRLREIPREDLRHAGGGCGQPGPPLCHVPKFTCSLSKFNFLWLQLIPRCTTQTNF